MASKTGMSLAVLYVLLLCSSTSDGARILSLVYPGRSQLGLTVTVLSELKSRGHDVWVVFADTFEISASMLRGSGINLLTFRSKEKMFLDDPEVQRDIFMAAVENPELRTSLFHITSAIQKMSRIFESYLEEMFVDKELDRKVSELNFDLMIVSGYWFFAKAYLFPHRYAVPYVSIVLDMQHLAGVPMLPSFVPSLAITAKCSDNMSLSQRILNVLPYLFLKHSLQPITPELSQKHAPGRPYMSTPELMAESELWIVNGGQPAIDHVKPSLPNTAQNQIFPSFQPPRNDVGTVQAGLYNARLNDVFPRRSTPFSFTRPFNRRNLVRLSS